MPFSFELILLIEFSVQRKTFRSDFFVMKGDILQFIYKTGKDEEPFPRGK